MKTLSLGLNEGFYNEVYFVKAMYQLGPNIWLARYTKDKKGRSRSWTVGLLGYRVQQYSTKTHEGFYPYGEVKSINSNYTLVKFYPRSVAGYSLPVAHAVARMAGDTRLTTGATLIVTMALTTLPKEMFDENDDSLRLYRYGDFISEDGEAE